MWLAPGEHISRGENLTTAVKREAKEELRFPLDQVDPPFQLTLTEPGSKKRPCKEHLDAWFIVEVVGCTD